MNLRSIFFQSYILEFGELYMRVVVDGGYVTEASFAITGMTLANPCVLDIPGNNFAAGDWIFINLPGVPQLSGRTVVARSAGGGTVTLQDVFGNPIDATAFAAYPGGGTASRIYTLATPYHAIDLPYLKFTQSADVMSLTCVNQETLIEYPPQELARLAANHWTISPPNFAASIAAPSGCTVAGTAYSTGPGPAAYGYVVTAIDAITGDESQPSPIGVVKSVVDIAGQFGTNTVTWPAVPGAQNYNVYKAAADYTNTGSFGGQLFGYVGSSRTTSWQDTNVIADFTTSPPLHTNPFAPGQILGVNMTANGSGYTAATAGVKVVSATGSGFVGVPIIGSGATGQQASFHTNPFIVGATVSQVVPAGTATGIVVAATGSTINIQVLGSIQFQGPGFSTLLNPITDTSGNSELPSSVVPVTIAGSGGFIGVYVENPGQFYEPNDIVVFSDSGSGTGAAGVLNVGPQSGNYPAVVTYFQQRRGYANSINAPDQYEFSQPGAYTDFDSADPPIDSDAITGTPWGEQINGIQWMLPMPGGLVSFTGKTTWQVSGTGGAGSPITPAQQSAQAQEGIGCSSTLPPLRIRYNILFGDALSSVVCEVNYNFFFNIYTGQDITVLSSQLFQNFNLVQWAFAFDPYRVVWAVRSDGKALSLTYVQEQDVRGWARHDTNGQFVSVAVASEPPANAPYFIVKRYVVAEGQWAYMQERIDNRLWQNVEQSFCLDSALTYPQSTPFANLVASAAQGEGGVKLNAIILGGSNYAAPVGVISDQAGIGQGASVSAFTVVGGVITGLTIVPGTNYQQPVLTITDSTGSGAQISLEVDNSVTFTADQNVFDGVHTGVVGQVLRMGGGIGTVSAYVSPNQIVAQVPPQSAIALTVPNDPNNMPIPAAAGGWSITTPIQTIYGLEHLNGMTVNALCDGFPVTGLTVQNGSITLPNPASAIVIGLPFVAQAQSMHADLGASVVQGKRKRIPGVTVRVANTRGIQVGQDQPIAAQLPNQIELPWNVSPNFMTDWDAPQMLAGAGNAVPLFTGDKYFSLAGDYSTTDGQPSPGMVAVQQLLPLPAEVTMFVPLVELGDVPDA